MLLNEELHREKGKKKKDKATKKGKESQKIYSEYVHMSEGVLPKELSPIPFLFSQISDIIRRYIVTIATASLSATAYLDFLSFSISNV